MPFAVQSCIQTQTNVAWTLCLIHVVRDSCVLKQTNVAWTLYLIHVVLTCVDPIVNTLVKSSYTTDLSKFVDIFVFLVFLQSLLFLLMSVFLLFSFFKQTFRKYRYMIVN